MSLERSLKVMLNFDNQLRIDVDENKVSKIIRRIILAELSNIKSEEKSDEQMAQQIRKMIEEEVNCY